MNTSKHPNWYVIILIVLIGALIAYSRTFIIQLIEKTYNIIQTWITFGHSCPSIVIDYGKLQWIYQLRFPETWKELSGLFPIGPCFPLTLSFILLGVLFAFILDQWFKYKEENTMGLMKALRKEVTWPVHKIVLLCLFVYLSGWIISLI